MASPLVEALESLGLDAEERAQLAFVLLAVAVPCLALLAARVWKHRPEGEVLAATALVGLGSGTSALAAMLVLPLGLDIALAIVLVATGAWGTYASWKQREAALAGAAPSDS